MASASVIYGTRDFYISGCTVSMPYVLMASYNVCRSQLDIKFYHPRHYNPSSFGREDSRCSVYPTLGNNRVMGKDTEGYPIDYQFCRINTFKCTFKGDFIPPIRLLPILVLVLGRFYFLFYSISVKSGNTFRELLADISNIMHLYRCSSPASSNIWKTQFTCIRHNHIYFMDTVLY